MYLRKMRPRTTCLYSAASILLRSLSAASQSLASKPRLAVESFEPFVGGFPLAMPAMYRSSWRVTRRKYGGGIGGGTWRQGDAERSGRQDGERVTMTSM